MNVRMREDERKKGRNLERMERKREDEKNEREWGRIRGRERE